jgi:hypothetical protein
MHTAKAARRATLDAEHLHQCAHGWENLCQEGTFGALPQRCGAKAPCVAGVNKACQHQNQDACDFLACNPRLQNNHFCPILAEGDPPCPHDRTVVTPIPVTMADEGAIHWPASVRAQEQQQASPQLPTLGQFTTMVVPLPAPNAGAVLPAAPRQAGAVNNAARERAVLAQRLIADAARVGVGEPIVVDEVESAAMHQPRYIDNMEAVGGINCAILQSTAIIGDAISASEYFPPPATAGNAAAYVLTIDSKLE